MREEPEPRPALVSSSSHALQLTDGPDLLPAAASRGFSATRHRMAGLKLARARAGRLPYGFVLIVCVPTILAAVWLCCFASDRYVAEFKASVRSIEQTKGAGLPALLGLTSLSGAGNDAYAVVQYLQSREALEAIDARIGLRAEWSSPDIDVWSRFDPHGPIEDFLRVWRARLNASYETTNGTITVRVTSFRPESAQAIATAALQLSEALVNRLSTRARSDTVEFAAGEVQKAEARLAAVDARIEAFRDREQVIDPRRTADSFLAMATKLREEIASTSADIAVQQGYLDEAAPSLTVSRAKLGSLNRELEKLSGQTTAVPSAGGRPLSAVLGEYDQLESERAFAEKNYQSALTSLETARIEATRQQIYLTTIVNPQLPQEAAFPKPSRDLAVTFGACLLIWLIGTLAVHAIREHV